MRIETESVRCICTNCHYAPQPNWGFNADTNSGHAFGIFMPAIGTLQPSASGAG